MAKAKLTEEAYCYAKALGHLLSAQQALNGIVVENVPDLNTEEFTNARAVIFRSSDILFNKLKVEN